MKQPSVMRFVSFGGQLFQQVADIGSMQQLFGYRVQKIFCKFTVFLTTLITLSAAPISESLCSNRKKFYILKHQPVRLFTLHPQALVELDQWQPFRLFKQCPNFPHCLMNIVRVDFIDLLIQTRSTHCIWLTWFQSLILIPQVCFPLFFPSCSIFVDKTTQLSYPDS